MNLLNKNNGSFDLSKISLIELWNEIGKRLNLKFGKIQMSFHNGRPSPYANVDMKVKTDETTDKEQN